MSRAIHQNDRQTRRKVQKMRRRFEKRKGYSLGEKAAKRWAWLESV